MEFYGFVHFGLYTFAPGTEGQNGPEVFLPKKFDPHQWVRAFKSAGMSGLLLTCKHHEGFCLWPIRYTDFSVKNSPWKDGKGDVVREVSDACREEGLKFGVYLSPWDMHESTYGTEAYNDYFRNQLEELLTNYGDVFCVWFDGACRAKKKKQLYDWESYYALIRRLQPEACVCICGPDVRWCGNEAGECRDAEWSVVPREILKAEQDAEYWRSIDTVPNATWKDLGSREFIRDRSDLIWYPAEVDASIRPSWGHVPGEDKKLHSLETLMRMYERSVGGNANLLLNVPPNPDGLFDDADVVRLAEMGGAIRGMLEHPQTEDASAVSEDTAAGSDASAVLDARRERYWQSKNDSVQPQIEIHFPCIRTVNLAVLQETIETGQHIEGFRIEVKQGGGWTPVYTGQTVGYKKICRFPDSRTNAVRIAVTRSRGFATLTNVGLYRADGLPPHA